MVSELALVSNADTPRERLAFLKHDGALEPLPNEVYHPRMLERAYTPCEGFGFAFELKLSMPMQRSRNPACLASEI